MAIAVKGALGRDSRNAIADTGYFSSGESRVCHKAGVMATMLRHTTSGNGRFAKADALRDGHVCTAGEGWTGRDTRPQGGPQVRRNWGNECQRCALPS